MNMFPAVDPIPLPAPVWIFKVLGVLTMALHFYAVQILLGGMLLAVLLTLWAAVRGRQGAGALPLNAAAILAGRLPVVMIYVINLGVPPLLFAQVLYGRAIYTSSVLIGAWWIAVIPLLMLCYALLYYFSAVLKRGQAAWWWGVGAWLVAAAIAKIYVTNMTLMVRPGVWQSMYTAAATGTHLPPLDPTLIARWTFMLSGGLVFGGLWMVWLAGLKRFDIEVRDYLRRCGGSLAFVAGIAQLVAAHCVFHNQPESIRPLLASSILCQIAGWGWFASMALVLAFCAWVGLTQPKASWVGWLGAGAAFLAVTTMTLFRDQLRDLTLLASGYDVWDRAVVTNWGVVLLFLLLFVIGLALVGWLISVMMCAKPISEKVA